MVFGIGEGKMDITLEKPSYVSGELMKGKVVLSLNQTKKAKSLTVQFYGEYFETVTGYEHVPGKPGMTRPTSHRVARRMYEQKLALGAEQDYPAGTKEYEFQFQLPTLAPATQAPQVQTGGVLGALENVALAGAAARMDPMITARWYVESWLDMPMSFDIRKKVQINFVR